MDRNHATGPEAGEVLSESQAQFRDRKHHEIQMEMSYETSQRIGITIVTACLWLWLGTLIGKSLNDIPEVTVFTNGNEKHNTVVERRP